MGRKRVPLKAINEERTRQITFSKRKLGLLKKAHELSILCSTPVAVLIFSPNNKMYQYASTGDIDELLLRYIDHRGPVITTTNQELLAHEEEEQDAAVNVTGATKDVGVGSLTDKELLEVLGKNPELLLNEMLMSESSPTMSNDSASTETSSEAGVFAEGVSGISSMIPLMQVKNSQ